MAVNLSRVLVCRRVVRITSNFAKTNLEVKLAFSTRSLSVVRNLNCSISNHKNINTSLCRNQTTTSKNDGKSSKEDDSNDDKQKKGASKQDESSSMFSIETRNQIKAISSQARSIPNIITITRICSTPILCNLIITENYQLAVAGCFVAGFSDWLDGYIARKYQQRTVLGSYLDPFADKILINSVALSLTVVDILPYWSSALWLGRDVLLIGMAFRLAAAATEGKKHNIMDPQRTSLKILPTTISKVNTLLQFGTVGASLCLAAVGDIECSLNLGFATFGVVDSMTYITGGTTIWSGLSYIDGKSMIRSGNSQKKKM